MSYIPDEKDGQGVAGSFLPVDPFYSLRAHFGLLLGVEDFQTIDAYHRGKMWLHNGWLHGEGAVWGLAVEKSLETGEIRVLPGLGIDRAGRELHLDMPFCLNVAAWYRENRDRLETRDAGGNIQFDAHVVIRFKSCLTRQVPALVEPCAGSGQTTAYSRVYETVELRMEPGLARRPEQYPYHRLRLLFNLDAPHKDEGGNTIPEDLEIIARRDLILAEPSEKQPKLYLDAFRELAAFDVIDLAPSSGSQAGMAGKDPCPMVLANIRDMTLSGDEGTGFILVSCEVDPTIRPSHVATRTIQELLCGPLFKEIAGEEPPPPGPDPDPDPDTPPEPDIPPCPRIDRASVVLREGNITFDIHGEVLEASLDDRSISVSSFGDSDGWVDEWVDEIVYTVGEGGAPNRIALTLNQTPSRALVRLIVRGRGATPVLGKDLVPLAGETGGIPGTRFDGIDFVHMFR